MNIKKNNIYENNNKTVMISNKNSVQNTSNFNNNRNNKTNSQINKISEKNSKNNKTLQKNINLNPVNNNNLLNQIIIGDKKNINKKEINNSDNIPSEVKVLFQRKTNRNNENYLKDNKTGKFSQFKNENNIINNHNKLKSPQDTIKKNLHKRTVSTKSYNNIKNINRNNLFGKNNNNNIEYIQKDDKKENKFKSLDTGKLIFNNIVRKKSQENKQLQNISKSIMSDDLLENIILLKPMNQPKKKNFNSDSLSEYYPKEELISKFRYCLYYIKNEKNYLNKVEQYSNSNDYDNIIKNNIEDKIILSQKLLQLKKRNWYNELKLISDEFKEGKDKSKKDENLFLYLKKITSVNEHFKWIINSISTYYNITFQSNKMFNPYFLNDINLPDINSSSWKQGFDWKGLHIIVIPEIYSDLIKKEIKAMNYCFFDYIQIKEKQDFKKDKRLSDDIIFPLIGYSVVNGIVIYVSALINPDKSFNNSSNFVDIFVDEIINHNKGIIDYSQSISNSDTNSSISTKEEKSKKKIYELIVQIEKNYYTEDLLESKLFLNMSEFHLIPFLGGKFIIINAQKLLPNLFEIKYQNYKQINILSEIKHNKILDTFLYDVKSKTYLNNISKQIYRSPKFMIENYNLNTNQLIKVNDIIINKVHFRILYENIHNTNKTYKNRRFIDNLINFGKDYFNIEDENKNIKYIGENYIIIYDLVQPLKLEYALIKNSKNENVQKRNKILFYFHANYISYFSAWCLLLNKNSFNIKTYSELKYTMKKFGINSNLKFFALMNIENEEITDIIKISILTKIIKYIYNQNKFNTNYNHKTKYLFEDEQIGKIFFLIKCILYINELSEYEKNKLTIIFEGLTFYMNIYFYKMRLIDQYLSLGLFNNENRDELNNFFLKDIPGLKEEYKELKEFDTSKIFLKNIIYTSRKKPFLFLSELELKLNFIINPFIKFKSSISIESMNKKLKLEHISLNNYFTIYSYSNAEEVSGLILVKLIKDYGFNKIQANADNLKGLKEKPIQYRNENDCKNIDIIPKEQTFINKELDLLETMSCNKIMNKEIYSNRKNYESKSPNKINSFFLDNTNSFIKWNKMCENIIIRLPYICYKMNFEYENTQNNQKLFKGYYKIPNNIIFIEHFSRINSIFRKIYSCDGKIEKSLLHSLITMYIISFFIEKNHEKCQNIMKKIKEIYFSGSYLLSFSELALINLFQGLNCEGYIDSEQYYSKTVMLFLMLFGDPRGRNNDSHPMMKLPLWKIVRKSIKLEKGEPGNNHYLYEMYKSLEFFNSSKDKLNSNIHNNIVFNYEKNLMKNIKSILKLNGINPIDKEKQNNNMNDINNFINKEFSLSKKIFDEEMIDLYLIKNFNFPFVEEDSNNVIKNIYSSEFIIYLFKQIQSILIGNYKLYNEKYINEYISDEVFNLSKNENKKISLRETSRKGMNKSSINIKAEFQKNEMEFSPIQLINAFQQGKKILEIFNFNNKINKDSKTNKIINNFPKKEINKNKTGKVGVFSHFLYDELLQKLSYKRNAPSGIVLTFGNNSHYETTYDDYKIIKYPLLIYKLKNIIVKKIYSGWEHNIIISNTNEIYSFGNNNNFQCAFPYSENYNKENKIIKTPQNISSLNGNIKGISASCGNEHTLILDENNDVYSFGNNEDGVLGVENNELKSYNFIKVNFGKYNGRIKDISSGTIHNIALTDDGNIFAWGSFQGGQLGLSEKFLTQQKLKNFSISSPILIPMKPEINNQEQTKIIKISCGEAHTIAIDSKKEVYSWGFGSNGQLGLGFCEDSFEVGTGLTKSRIFTPQKIKTLQKKKISDIQCGKTFSMFIDSNGGLYSCGVNDLYQLGIPDLPPQIHIKNIDSQCKDFVIPTRLEYFLDMKVEKISCGEAHCVAIVKDIHSNEKLVWSWGNNRYGQLGLGDEIKKSLPKPITLLFEYKSNKFESVSCGGFHSLCLIKHNEDINWIEDDFKYYICRVINEMWNF